MKLNTKHDTCHFVTNNRKTQKSKHQLLLPIGFVAALATIGISGCSSSNPISNSKNAASQANSDSQVEASSQASAESVVTVEKGGYLSIPIKDLSQTASFYKADLGDTEVEIVALKDSNGNLRTAFNACQVCYSSGRGYYVQDGDYLVCQNCGNSFTIDQVGVLSGGCNPWPILDDDRTVTDDEIQISYDVLKSTADELPNFFEQ